MVGEADDVVPVAVVVVAICLVEACILLVEIR
jgi:hypothetical protein